METTDDDLTAGTEGSLIAAGKVVGTSVYGPDHVHIGEVADIMIRKVSGQVAYAVLSVGGFLGLGARHCALPWQMLKYDTGLGGFVVPTLTRDRLERAPVYDADREGGWADVDAHWA
jgi:hypothetical protein